MVPSSSPTTHGHGCNSCYGFNSFNDRHTSGQCQLKIFKLDQILCNGPFKYEGSSLLKVKKGRFYGV